MNVIKFPILNDKKPPAPSSLPKLHLGPFSINCHCGNVSQVTPSNMIFKCLEFYCSKCGSPHVITNPALGQYQTKPRNK